jgi:hypothetical protein
MEGKTPGQEYRKCRELAKSHARAAIDIHIIYAMAARVTARRVSARFS